MPDQPTTRDHYEELLTCALLNWRKALDDPDCDERSHAMAHACSYFSTAWLLHSFMKVDEAAADKAMAELHDILSDGGAAGEHIWQMLASLGVDPDTITAAGSETFTCPHCGLLVDEQPGKRDTRHDHCGPLPHTGPIGGPYCDRCA